MVVLVLLGGAGLSFFRKNNFLMYFIALELIVLAINLQFIFTSLTLQEGRGLFVAVLLLAIAAIDTAIGLSLLIKYHNLMGTVQITSLVSLKG